MPYFLVELKKLTKATTKSSLFLHEPNRRYSENFAAFGEATPLLEKPAEIPEGHTLRFLPTYAEIDTMRQRNYQRAQESPHQLPWEQVSEDGDPAPSWSRHLQDQWQMVSPQMQADGSVAYYQSWLHNWEDRPEVTTLGRLLHWFWDTIDAAYQSHMTQNYGKLTDALITKWTTIQPPRSPADVKFTNDEAEMLRVYRNGPSSCMVHPVEKYHSKGIHPLAVYAGSDLMVAYITKRNDDTKIQQRALVFPKKKVIGRVYGTGSLVPLLKQLGYREFDNKTHNFDGARLKKIFVPGTDNAQIVFPSIDLHHYVVERKDHLAIVHKWKSHPLVPEDQKKVAMQPYQPRATKNRAVWACSAAGMSGVVKYPIVHICATEGCKTVVNSKGQHCKKCLADRCTCVFCYKTQNFTQDEGFWLPELDTLGKIRTVRDIERSYNKGFYHGQTACQTCLTASRKKDYLRHGYVAIPFAVRKKQAIEHAAENADANAPVPPPDGQ